MLRWNPAAKPVPRDRPHALREYCCALRRRAFSLRMAGRGEGLVLDRVVGRGFLHEPELAASECGRQGGRRAVELAVDEVGDAAEEQPDRADGPEQVQRREDAPTLGDTRNSLFRSL